VFTQSCFSVFFRRNAAWNALCISHGLYRGSTLPLENRVASNAGKEAAAAVHAAAPAIAIQTPPGQAAAIDASTRELHDLAFRHGECYDSYLATEPGRTLFWARDREGVVSYVRRGGNLLAGGGLLTAPERKEELLHAFLDMASRDHRRVMFHNICEHDLPLFRKFGFEVTKWGEEPIVDLANCTWAGKSYEWVRRQSNYCLRQGLTAFEVKPGISVGSIWAMLSAFGGLRLNVGQVVRILFERLRKRSTRATLAHL
jgi:lysylphosphatidylglycerol synthetase-like protein (DUF2156 family)